MKTCPLRLSNALNMNMIIVLRKSIDSLIHRRCSFSDNEFSMNTSRKQSREKRGGNMLHADFAQNPSRFPSRGLRVTYFSHLNKFHEDEIEQSNGDSQNESDSGSSQQKLEDVFKRKLNSRVKRALDKKLITFVAKSSLPLDIAAEDYFRDFISELNPAYKLPCPKTQLSLMRSEVNSIHEFNKKIFSKDCMKITITADGWSSKNSSSSVLAVTGHALSADFSDRKDVILDVIPMEEEG